MTLSGSVRCGADPLRHWHSVGSGSFQVGICWRGNPSEFSKRRAAKALKFPPNEWEAESSERKIHLLLLSSTATPIALSPFYAKAATNHHVTFDELIEHLAHSRIYQPMAVMILCGCFR